ncbi:MAG: hypothetical protein ACYC25_17215 [Paludibacter sp.]
MSTLTILNQDQDIIVEYDREKNEPALFTAPAIHNNTLMGINLFAGEYLLGTFDNVGEALTEIQNILSCTEDHYGIGGFSDWGEFDQAQWSELVQAMGGYVDEEID